MKWSSLWVVLLSSAAATTAMGQTATPDDRVSGDVAGELERVVAESGVTVALDSVARVAAPVLEETLSQLSVTLGDLAVRVASDPELRRSAFAAAQGIAQVTSTVVAENAEVIQEALRKAAEELERMGSKPESLSAGVGMPSPEPAGAPSVQSVPAR